MRILIDCDGVVCDLVTHAGLRHEEVKHYDYVPLVRALFRPGFAVGAPIYPGAVMGVNHLLADGHEVVFVTKPCPFNETWTFDRDSWLDMWFPGVPVVHTAYKELIWGDLLIDDDPDNLRAWVMAHPMESALLWTRPWNRLASRWHRVEDWKTVRRMCS